MHEDYDALNRRQFFKLSGVIGATAAVAGASPVVWRNLAEAAAESGPNPSTCGALDSSDHLWRAVQNCNGGSGCKVLPKNADAYVFAGTNTHNFITVPKERVNGIECPWICETGTPNYWQDAWNWAHTSPAIVDAPVGLGINSADKGARQADQLHIHMAQVRSESLNDLKNQDGDAATGTDGWPKSRVSITGYSSELKVHNKHVYRVLKLSTLSTNLFARLRDMVGQQQMEHQTLIVIPRPAGGYYIVNSQKSLTDHNLIGSNTCDPLLELPH